MKNRAQTTLIIIVIIALIAISGTITYIILKPSEPDQPSKPVIESGGVYYVSKGGDDDNQGSEENPWLTIQKAADSIKSGDTIYVKEGSYEESITISKSGGEEERITISNFEDDKVNIIPKSCHGFYVEASYITIKGFDITNSYYRENSNCPDWTASGITTHKAHNIFEDNEISNSMYGIMIRADIGEEAGVIWPTEGNNIIRNNYIHDTDYAAVRVKRSNNNIIENNRFYNNHLKLSSFNDKENNILFYLEAPLVFYCLDGLKVENNEFYEPKFGPLILELDMVTRTDYSPSMAPNPEKTNCPLFIDNVIIKNNTGKKTKDKKYPILLTFGRDFALGSDNMIDNNKWSNGNPGSKIIEWGYNFWHDNDEDDKITPEVWTLKEFQENTLFDINSEEI